MDQDQPIMVVGSLNMDQTVWTTRVPEAGETIMGERFAQFYGGKGANQAVAAARTGAKVAMVGRVGQDELGKDICRHMQQQGVDMRCVQATDGISSGVAMIMVEASAQNRIVVAPGANAEVSAKDVRTAFEQLGAPGIVLCQLEIPDEAVACALDLGRHCGAMTILNPAPVPEQGLDALASYMLFADLIVPNEKELSALTGMQVTDVDTAEAAAKALLKDHAFAVLVTLGEKGSLYVDDHQTYYVAAAPSEPVDTTGAGDSYLGALTAALAKGCTIQEAMIVASAVAAMVVGQSGAQTAPDVSQLKAYAVKHDIQLPPAVLRGQIHIV